MFSSIKFSALVATMAAALLATSTVQALHDCQACYLLGSAPKGTSLEDALACMAKTLNGHQTLDFPQSNWHYEKETLKLTLSKSGSHSFQGKIIGNLHALNITKRETDESKKMTWKGENGKVYHGKAIKVKEEACVGLGHSSAKLVCEGCRHHVGGLVKKTKKKTGKKEDDKAERECEDEEEEI